MKWLLTCFEPFDQARTNSSEIVWRRLQATDWADEVLFLGPLPVTFQESWVRLEAELARNPVDGVLALGQAEGRARVSLETVALNWIDARIPDNAGLQPKMAPIDSSRPLAIWSNIPWAELGENERWQRSYSAGTYVCNYLLFQIMKWAEAEGRKGGFVHIPVLESQMETQFDSVPKIPDAHAAESLRLILNHLRGLR